MVDFGVGVIIPSAGSGERLGGPLPKQYCKILDKPLFLYALEGFASLGWIKRIVLVVDNAEKVRTILQEAGDVAWGDRVALVEGEATRHRSIRAGLRELQRLDADGELRVVMVHDGVRPIVPAWLVADLAAAADVHGAGGCTRPLISTVVQTAVDGFLERCLDRGGLYLASETPQAFRTAVLVAAYAKCTEHELDHGTECLQLVLQHCGVKAKLIAGPEELWKVTHKRDLYAATACIRERRTDVCLIADERGGNNEAVEAVRCALVTRVNCVERQTVGVSGGGGGGEGSKRTFDTVVLFYLHEISEDQHLLDFAALLDLDRPGLIIHVIEHAGVDGMQSMSVYSLQRGGRTMAHRYNKLRKGVVVIHCVSLACRDGLQRLADLVSALVQSDPLVYSGQTLFL